MSVSVTPIYYFPYPNGDDALSLLAQRIEELAFRIEATYTTLGIDLNNAYKLMQDGDPAGGVLSGTYPNPSFAVDMTTQAEFDTHTSASTSVHGISDTADLVYTSDSRLSDERVPTNNSVSTIKIVNGAVTEDKIASDAVTAGKIAADAVGSDEIQAGSVTSSKIQSSVSLAGSPTTTTQANSDNSTKIATTAFVKNTYISDHTLITDHIADTTSVHGISDTADLVYTNDARLSDERTPLDNSVTNAKVDAGAAIEYSKLDLVGSIQESDLDFQIATQAELDIVSGELAAHEADTTSVHGITDTSNLVYTNDSRLSDERTPLDNSVTNNKVSATAAIDYSKLNLSNSVVNSDISSMANIDYTKLDLVNSIINADIASTAAIEYSKLDLVGSVQETDLDFSIATQAELDIVSGDLNNHISDTTNVHGISDTSNLVYTNDARLTNERIPTDGSVTNNKVSATAAIAYSKLDLTGSVKEADLDFSIATQAELDTVATNLSNHEADTTSVHGISDTADLVYTNDTRLSNARTPTSHASTHGSAGSDPVTIANTQVTGLGTASTYNVPSSGDAASGEVVKGSDTRLTNARNVAGGTANDIPYQTAANTTSFITGGSPSEVLTVGALGVPEWAPAGTPAAHHLTHELGGADEVTLDKTQISGTAITAADTGTVTSTMIANGTIIDADVNASAAIAASKISGTAVTQADTGTVTSTMIANDTIVDADINTAAAISPSKISGTAVITSDSRLSDARTPTGSAGGDLTGTYPNPTLPTSTNTSGAGTYNSVTVNTKGLVTAGTNPTTLAGYGITDAVSSTATQTANTVFAGPTTGAAAAPTFRALVNNDLPTTGVSAGTYQAVTVNVQGVVTSGSTQALWG